MITGIEPWRSCIRCSSCQPSTPGMTTSSRTSSGAWSSIAASASSALGLADRVALELEVDAHELAQARVVVDDEHERPARLARRGRSGRGTARGRGAGSGGGRPACRTPARGPGRTTCGSSTGRRRGTSPPGRGSASRARSSGRVCRGDAHRPQNYPKLSYLNRLRVLNRDRDRLAGRRSQRQRLSVRTSVCVPPGFGLSCSASPSAIPTTKRQRRAPSADRRDAGGGSSGRILTGGSPPRRARRRGRPRRRPCPASAAALPRGRRRRAASRAQSSAPS